MRHNIAPKESRGVCLYHNPSLPHLSMLGDQALASDNMTRINIELGEQGHFALKSGKMCHFFFHDCRLGLKGETATHIVRLFEIRSAHSFSAQQANPCFYSKITSAWIESMSQKSTCHLFIVDMQWKHWAAMSRHGKCDFHPN